MNLVDRGCNRASKTVNDTLTRFNLVFLPGPELQLKVRLRHSLFVQVQPQVIVGLSGFHLRQTAVTLVEARV